MVMNDTRRQNPTMCKGRYEAGIHPVSETCQWIEQKGPFLVWEGERMTLLLIKRGKDGVVLLRCD